ncbi:MAG: sortase domain-containing protein, partial [Gaiellales bacterium]
PGQRVEVARRVGSTSVFAVTKVAQYAMKDFPTNAVYGSVDHAALRLITCGGVFDGENDRYLDNVIVFARLVRARPA